jgi:hypothetical protein
MMAVTLSATRAITSVQYTFGDLIREVGQGRDCAIQRQPRLRLPDQRPEGARPSLQLNPAEVWITCRTIRMITAVKNSQIRGTRFKIRFILSTLIEISIIAGTDLKRLAHRSIVHHAIVFALIGKESIHLNGRCGKSDEW